MQRGRRALLVEALCPLTASRGQAPAQRGAWPGLLVNVSCDTLLAGHSQPASQTGKAQWAQRSSSRASAYLAGQVAEGRKGTGGDHPSSLHFRLSVEARMVLPSPLCRDPACTSGTGDPGTAHSLLGSQGSQRRLLPHPPRRGPSLCPWAALVAKSPMENAV